MSANLAITGPLTIGQIVSRTFGLYKAHFGRFVLAAAIFMVPGQVMAYLVGESGFGLLLAALQGLATLAITAVALAALEGRPATLRESLGEAWPRVWVYIRVSFLQGLVALAILVPGVVLMIFGQKSAAGGPLMLASGLLIFAGILLLFYLLLRWSVTTPAIMVDREGVIRALERSRELTRHHVWHCLGVGLLLGLILVVPVAVWAVFTSSLGGALETVLDAAADILLWPLDVIAAVVLYCDLRARQEPETVPTPEPVPMQHDPEHWVSPEPSA